MKTNRHHVYYYDEDSLVVKRWNEYFELCLEIDTSLFMSKKKKNELHDKADHAYQLAFRALATDIMHKYDLIGVSLLSWHGLHTNGNGTRKNRIFIFEVEEESRYKDETKSD